MRRPICLLAMLATLPVTAAAQDGSPGEPILLDGIVLTAGITPVAQDGYARAHTVLTATEIEIVASPPSRTPCARCPACRSAAAAPARRRFASAGPRRTTP
ncbi:hypothetical protein [Paracoccus sp. PAMC 22219]|uniref:hypothetical protein n=1 Tax=Paracoccus sp. PAMC 22219 TaxID=1569209 RepID=UPI0018CCAF4B|nr:hypothetical protein [Paracoccus sp. PAMC 22219]